VGLPRLLSLQGTHPFQEAEKKRKRGFGILMLTSDSEVSGFKFSLPPLQFANFYELRSEDDEEDVGTTTKYMISFFCSGDYKGPPSGRVIVHLLGSIFPGRVRKATGLIMIENRLLLFPPSFPISDS